MPDIFNTLSADSNNEKTVPNKDATDKASTSKNSGTTSRSKKTTPTDKVKEGTSISSVNVDLLAKTMMSGFQDMAASLKDMGKDISDSLEKSITESFECQNQFFDYDCMEEGETNESQEEDIFSCITEDSGIEDKIGPKVKDSLANMVNQFLSKKRGENADKVREDKYDRPENIEFLESQKINKPIWENISGCTKMTDSSLQLIQKNFLKACIPIVKVMESLSQAKENGEALEHDLLITSLADSLAFIGAANISMIKKRKDLLKKDIPKKFQGLCQDHVSFSSSQLFGDNLSAQMKQVGDFCKVSDDFKFAQRGRSRSFLRGRPRFGRNRSFGSRGQRGYRSRPYNVNSRGHERKFVRGSKNSQ